jgi:hypothetical protein
MEILMTSKNHLRLLLQTDNIPSQENLPEKLLKAYAQMKMKTDHWNQKLLKGKRKWNPKLHDAVIIKCQNTSDARSYWKILGTLGPYYSSNMVNPNLYELKDENIKPRGLFHLKHLKPYSRSLE